MSYVSKVLNSASWVMHCFSIIITFDKYHENPSPCILYDNQELFYMMMEMQGQIGHSSVGTIGLFSGRWGSIIDHLGHAQVHKVSTLKRAVGT